MTAQEKDIPSPGVDATVSDTAPIEPPPHNNVAVGNVPQVSPTAPLDKIYAEAGHWVRMVNTVTWTLAAFLLPASVSLIVAVFTTNFCPILLGAASIVLILFWRFADNRYEMGVKPAREVLARIETQWGIAPESAFYTQQNLRVAMQPTLRQVFRWIG